MGWVIIDDFEGGVIDSNWIGDDTVLISTADSSLDGSYLLAVDTDSAEYSASTEFQLVRTDTAATISRNSNSNETFRLLYEPGIQKSATDFLIKFFYQDFNNYYVIEMNTSAEGLHLGKVVSGTYTSLATAGYGANYSGYSLAVKCETSLISLIFYDGVGFTTETSDFSRLTTTDTEFSSGGIALCCNIPLSPDQGPFQPHYDNISVFEDDAASPTIQGISNINGVQSITI